VPPSTAARSTARGRPAPRARSAASGRSRRRAPRPASRCPTRVDRAEQSEQRVDVRAQYVQPRIVRRLGDETRELAVGLAVRRDRRELDAPGIDLALANARLRAVVDHHRERRVALEDAREPRQVLGSTSASNTRPWATIASNTGVCAGRASQSSSAMSCTIGRRPTSRGSAARCATASGASRASKSNQPTTRRRTVSRARSQAGTRSRPRSARLGRRIVRSMPCRARIGARSSGPKSRWIGASAGVSHP